MGKIIENIVIYIVTIVHPKLVVHLATKQQETLETKEHAQKIITESQKKIKQYITKLKSYVEEE